MKKLVCILCCIVLVASLVSLFAGCDTTPRENVLKIYVPGDYIDEDIFEGFEAWYEETYKIPVKVKCKTFDTVEKTKLALESKADYDLLCPSDYMIEYLIANELVQKIDKSIIDISEEGLFKNEYIQTTQEFDPTLEYSVPYMYGTFGIMYDYSKTGKKITSWDALFGDEYVGERSFKASERDLYAALCIYNAKDDVDAVSKLTGDAQKAKIQSIFADTSDATIAAAKDTFLATKAKGDVWDSDSRKFEMAANAKGSPYVALMWSCDAGYVMNTYENRGKSHPGNHNLWYVVPDEGGNIYLDSFVIGKYAQNTHAANAFLYYISTPEIAVQNSEFAGVVSPVAAAYDELKAYYTGEECDLFTAKDIADGWKDMFIEMMFPSTDTLNRCGVMKNFGAKQKDITVMYNKLKGAK